MQDPNKGPRETKTLQIASCHLAILAIGSSESDFLRPCKKHSQEVQSSVDPEHFRSEFNKKTISTLNC